MAKSRPSKTAGRVGAFFSLIRKTHEATIGFVIATVFLLTAVIVEIADLLRIQITPYNPLASNAGPSLAPPSFSHPFGTDLLGRDVFSRIVSATPNDVAIGVSVVAVALILGTLIGTLAAFRGGLLDELLMRFTDVIFALPVLVIAKVIAVGGFGVGVAKFPVDCYGLFEVAGCLLMAAEVVVRVADGVERGGLTPPVAEVLEQA